MSIHISHRAKVPAHRLEIKCQNQPRFNAQNQSGFAQTIKLHLRNYVTTKLTSNPAAIYHTTCLLFTSLFEDIFQHHAFLVQGFPPVRRRLDNLTTQYSSTAGRNSHHHVVSQLQQKGSHHQ